ncbi:hypothetical protein BX616_000961 [Lobosporangium transversale]|nr:hypothetical protein BX616_000961 [Lobosporangium transversale]
MLIKDPWSYFSTLPWLSLGQIRDTLDALIIFEACRQGVLPRITRRLLAAERGELNPRIVAPCDECSPALPSLSNSASSASNISTSSRLTKLEAPTLPSSVGQQASLPDPTLIVPGSVFVFDESESGICRWTDGRIWSPSRINGNFLVYKELFRKLSNEKCTSTADKERMRTGSGLTDEALRAKIEKDNLVVQGSSKGTFVLKKNGLIKKTICVRGVNALSLQELKDRYERSTQSCSNACSRRISSPHFSVTGTQHLVCYEREDMGGLYRPSDYMELKDLPLSRAFIEEQSFRNQIHILPLKREAPIDPFDFYISSARIMEGRPGSPGVKSQKPNPMARSVKQMHKAKKIRGSRGESEDSSRSKNGGASGDESLSEGSSTITDRDPEKRVSKPNQKHRKIEHSKPLIPNHPYSTRAQERLQREALQHHLGQQSSVPSGAITFSMIEQDRPSSSSGTSKQLQLKDKAPNLCETNGDCLSICGYKNKEGKWRLRPAPCRTQACMDILPLRVTVPRQLSTYGDQGKCSISVDGPIPKHELEVMKMGQERIQIRVENDIVKSEIGSPHISHEPSYHPSSPSGSFISRASLSSSLSLSASSTVSLDNRNSSSDRSETPPSEPTVLIDQTPRSALYSGENFYQQVLANQQDLSQLSQKPFSNTLNYLSRSGASEFVEHGTSNLAQASRLQLKDENQTRSTLKRSFISPSNILFGHQYEWYQPSRSNAECTPVTESATDVAVNDYLSDSTDRLKSSPEVELSSPSLSSTPLGTLELEDTPIQECQIVYQSSSSSSSYYSLGDDEYMLHMQRSNLSGSDPLHFNYRDEYTANPETIRRQMFFDDLPSNIYRHLERDLQPTTTSQEVFTCLSERRPVREELIDPTSSDMHQFSDPSQQEYEE